MKDWKLRATGLSIPEADLEKIIPVMDALEAAFRPLIPDIPLETEPAIIFQVNPEETA
jgi:hypothetical protein